MCKGRLFPPVGWSLAVIVVGLCLVSPQWSQADVTYTYTGNQLNSFFGGFGCPPDCFIGGSFTLATSLGDNFAGKIAPLSFDFFVGPSGPDISSANGGFICGHCDFSFQTNGAGQIVLWNIAVVNSNSFITTSLLPGIVIEDNYELDTSAAYAQNTNDPGVWATPEPSSLLLLATGLLGLGPIIRRRTV